ASGDNLGITTSIIRAISKHVYEQNNARKTALIIPNLGAIMHETSLKAGLAFFETLATNPIKLIIETDQSTTGTVFKNADIKDRAEIIETKRPRYQNILTRVYNVIPQVKERFLKEYHFNIEFTEEVVSEIIRICDKYNLSPEKLIAEIAREFY